MNIDTIDLTGDDSDDDIANIPQHIFTQITPQLDAIPTSTHTTDTDQWVDIHPTLPHIRRYNTRSQTRRIPQHTLISWRHTNTRRKKTQTPEFFKTFLKNARKCAINIGGLAIPKYVLTAAALGPKFAYPTYTKIQPEHILGAHTAINQLTQCIENDRQKKEIHRQLRLTLSSTLEGLRNHRSPRTPDPIVRKLKNIFTKCKRFLHNNPNVIICNSDKGNVGIVCPKSFVEGKRDTHLADSIEQGIYAKIMSAQDEIGKLEFLKSLFCRTETDYLDLITRMNYYLVGGYRLAIETDTFNTRNTGRKNRNGLTYETIRTNGTVHIRGDPALGYPGFRKHKFKAEAYSLAKLYVSIKVHKDVSYPVRPIISAPSAIGSDLEEWMQVKLDQIVSPRNVSNSFDSLMNNFGFVANNSDMVLDGIKQFGLQRGHRLVSLDFVSMYTNIDRNQVKSAILENYHLINKITSMPKTLFIEALEFLLHRNAYFSAGGDIFFQQKGLPMGGKLSKTLSELVTATATVKAIRDARARGFSFSFLYKYVDDYIVGMCEDHLPSSKTLNALERIFEEHIPGMRVTSEVETCIDNSWQLKFLEFTTIRASLTDQKIETRWSRQKYASTRFVNAFTHIPIGQKESAIRELLSKALRYSTPDMQEIALADAVRLLEINGYTTNTITTTLHTMPLYTDLENRTRQTHTEPLPTSHTAHAHTNGNHKHRGNFTCEVCGRIVRSRNTSDKRCRTCSTSTGPTAPLALALTGTRTEAAIGTTNAEAQVRAIARSNINVRKALKRTAYSSEFDNTLGKRLMLGPNTTPRHFTPMDRLRPKVSEYTPQYIQIPPIKGLDAHLNGVLQRWEIDTKFAAAASDNGFFKKIKDPMPTIFDSMVTFTLRCRTCQSNILFNATDRSVVNEMARCAKAHAPDHELVYNSAHIIARYPTRARAHIGLDILQKINDHLENPATSILDKEWRDIIPLLTNCNSNDIEP